MSDITEILLSGDRFENEILAEAIKAEGFDVSLGPDQSLGTFGLSRPSTLFVQTSDVDAVREIIARSF